MFNNKKYQNTVWNVLDGIQRHTSMQVMYCLKNNYCSTDLLFSAVKIGFVSEVLNELRQKVTS